MPFRSMPWGGARATKIETGGMAVSFRKRPGSIFADPFYTPAKYNTRLTIPYNVNPKITVNRMPSRIK